MRKQKHMAPRKRGKDDGKREKNRDYDLTAYIVHVRSFKSDKAVKEREGEKKIQEGKRIKCALDMIIKVCDQLSTSSDRKTQ